MTTFERVKQISKKHGYSSLRTLAEDAGLSQNALYSWRKNEPSSKSAKAVADVLGVSVDYLLGNTDETTINNVSNKSQPADLNDILSDESIAMFDGQPLSEEYKRALLAMLRANRGQ